MSTRTPLIRDFMTAAPVCVAMDAELDDAAALMQKHGIHHLPVMEDDELVGIVSERDLSMIQSILADEWRGVRVAEAMTPAPYSVHPDAQVAEVADHMASAHIGCAVVASDGKV